MGEVNKTLRAEEKKLLGLLNASLTKRSTMLRSMELPDELFAMADKHSVAPLIFDPVAYLTGGEGRLYEQLQASAVKCSFQSYRLLFETRSICDLLEGEGIRVAVLKGAAVASFYPVPEYRKSGDIDILLCDIDKKRRALEILKENGYKVSKNQPALHQIVLESRCGIEIELHILLAEPFDNDRINRYMDSLIPDIGEHIRRRRVMGIQIPLLDDKYQAYELLLHMLQHFLRRGFGIKLLCDWVVYWNHRYRHRSGEFALEYKRLVSDSGLTGFSDMITSVCYRYLGLSKEAAHGLIIDTSRGMADKKTVSGFLREVLDGGEFGDHEKDRMVMLRNASLKSYIIEFHHQMHLNFPKAGIYPVLWPILWTYTLVRFLYNNINKRHTTVGRILKKTGERSRIMKQIHLWEK